MSSFHFLIHPSILYLGLVFFVGTGCLPRSVAWYDRPLPLQIETLSIKIRGKREIMHYSIVGPEHCMKSQRCPVMIVLPGGAQNENLMQEGLRPWAQGLKRRGWLLLSPVALDDKHLFFQKGGEELILWTDRMIRRYTGKGPKPVLVGVSNGGISAFQVLQHRPKMFRSVLVAPGYAQRARLPKGTAPITMVVGEHDTWRDLVRRQAVKLSHQGHSVHLVQVPKTGHLLFDFLTVQKLIELLRLSVHP